MNTSIIFNSTFANNTISSYFFFFFLIIELYLLFPAVIAQIFNPIAELVVPMIIPRKEAKAEKEIDLVTAKKKFGHYNLELCKSFRDFYSSIHFGPFL